MRGLFAIAVPLMLLLCGQIGFAWTLRDLLPHRDLLPPVPSPRMVAVESFGDPQFLFRTASLDLQNAGDTGGRIVPIKNYDFTVVLGWLHILQQLDPRSDIPAELASGFYGLSQDLGRVPPIVRFIQENVALHPEKRWRFLYPAIYFAQIRLHDTPLALEVAQQLAAYGPDVVPLVAALMPGFIFERSHDLEDARATVEQARQRYAGRLSPEEDAWSLKYLDYLAGRGPRPR